MIAADEVFVRGTIPDGPMDAMLAWAAALGNVAVVLEVQTRPSGTVDVAYEVADPDGQSVMLSAFEAVFLGEWRRL